MTRSNTLVSSSPKRTRRTFTRAFKAELVALAESGTTSVAQVAMDNQVNANLLRRWVTLARDSTGRQSLVPVSVAQSHGTHAAGNGPLEVALPHATLRFHYPWNPDAVAALLKALR